MIAAIRNSNVMHFRGRVAACAIAATLVVMAATGCSSDDGPLAVRLVPALGGARFEQPIEVAAYPGGAVLVAERGGRIWLAGESAPPRLLADLRSLVELQGEGLLSVAVDPRFQETGWLWAYYFARGDPRTVLARFAVEDGAVDPASVLPLIEFPQPGFNQNGGAVRFDGEGYLYLSVGDGSASTDPFLQGQDRSTLLATVLRLDVRDSSPAAPYRIPSDNPFVGEEGVRPEIYAYGFRNPFRMSVDPLTEQVWLGDVGFTFFEEVNLVEAGGNYGWSLMEGDRCMRRAECEQSGLLPPAYAYPHEGGRCAVIGGFVYRGRALPALEGRYLFGDFCSGEIIALPADIEGGEAPATLAVLGGALVTFGRDAEGEVLVADHDGGGVYRLVRDPGGTPGSD